MRNTLVVLILVIGLIGIAVPLLSHHPFSAEFDVNKPVFMDGRVTRVEWQNPHVDVFIEVTDKLGKTVNWDVELNPPHFLLDNGWKKDTLKRGMDVCVEGFPEKNGKPKFGSTTVMLKATGQILKTPPGIWIAVGQVLDVISPHSVETEVKYSGKTSCSNRTGK